MRLSSLSVVALAFAMSSCSSGCASVPRGEAGPAADALAREAEAWVDRAAWERTGAISFTFRDDRTHLWDRVRGMHKMVEGDLVVWLDLWDRGGVATRSGVPLEGQALDLALARAWKFFINDTFWLNPLSKLFDEGTRRELVDAEGDARGLLVTYGSGGVTPGDSYLWLVDKDGRPMSVKMWVSVLPVKGLEFEWADWVTLPTGAKLALAHKTGGTNGVPIKNLEGAATLEELTNASVNGEDPFRVLVERRARR